MLKWINDDILCVHFFLQFFRARTYLVQHQNTWQICICIESKRRYTIAYIMSPLMPTCCAVHKYSFCGHLVKPWSWCFSLSSWFQIPQQAHNPKWPEVLDWQLHKEKVVLIERLIPSETEIEAIAVPKLKVLCLASCKKNTSSRKVRESELENLLNLV